MSSKITFDCTNLSGILFIYTKNNLNNVTYYRIMPGETKTLVTGSGAYDVSEMRAGLIATTYDISGASAEYSIDGTSWKTVTASTTRSDVAVGNALTSELSTDGSGNSDTYAYTTNMYPKLGSTLLMRAVNLAVRDRTVYYRDSSEFEANKDHIIYSLTEPAGSSHTITCTLPKNTTASISFPYKIEDGQSTSFTVSPASGYKITDLSAKVGDVLLGVSQLTTGAWTITTGEVTADEEIVITATVVEDTVTITVNSDVDSNVTTDAKTSTITKGKDFNLYWEVSTNEEYEKLSANLTTTPEVKYSFDPLYNDDSEVIGAYYTWSNVQQDFTIDLSVHRTDLSYSVTISDSTTYNDLVLSHTPENISSLTGAQTITVTLGSNSATESYRFSDAPAAEKTSGGLITGVLSTNKQIATYSIPEDNSENITITVANDNIETFTPTPTTEDYPHFTYAYLPTAGQIKTISDAQWLTDQGAVDLITYANRYEQLLDTLTSDKTREMYLGSVDVGIKVAYLESRVFTRDLGTVAIEEHFHDADDYKSTTIRIYVPLYGYVDLDPSDCMGHNIGLSYKYEVDSGRALAMVYCDFLDPKTILWQGAVNFAIEEPIGSLGASDYTSSYWTILTQQLGELKPYVVITRKTPATDILDVRGRRGQKVVKVSDVTGFVKFDTIFLTGIKASLTELNEISSYLKTGVLVN